MTVALTDSGTGYLVGVVWTLILGAVAIAAAAEVQTPLKARHELVMAAVLAGMLVLAGWFVNGLHH